MVPVGTSSTPVIGTGPHGRTPSGRSVVRRPLPSVVTVGPGAPSTVSRTGIFGSHPSPVTVTGRGSDSTGTVPGSGVRVGQVTTSVAVCGSSYGKPMPGCWAETTCEPQLGAAARCAVAATVPVTEAAADATTVPSSEKTTSCAGPSKTYAQPLPVRARSSGPGRLASRP